MQSSSKYHKILFHHLSQCLREVFEEKKYADKVLEKTFKSNKILGARDRAFIAEAFYEIIRYYRRLIFCLPPNPDWWSVMACYFVTQSKELPDWPEFSSISRESILSFWKESEQIRAIRESVPDWLDELGTHELGTQWDIELHALNQPAPMVVRVNTLKTSKSELMNQFAAMNLTCESSEIHQDAIIIREKKNIFSTDLFKNGFFELQDASSQMVAEFCKVNAGMRVVDACAGAGGKSLHLASLMKNKGQILALDTEEWKLKELKSRAKRNGIQMIETRVIDSNKVIKRLNGTADRLLLDVPCSGLGVLKRNPDTKYKLTQTYLDKVHLLQSQIIQNYSRICKKNAYVIYATCSILPSENEFQVQKFLESNPEFELEEQKSILPSTSRFDGFYMARLRRRME